MPPNAAEVARPQSPLRIKQDGNFYERLLTKESSGANPSCRYYWAEPGSVPFVWESQPGMPRDASRVARGSLMPEITPLPSYLLPHGDAKVQVTVSRRPKSKPKGKRRYCRFKRIKVGFIAGILRRLTLGKTCRRSAPSSAQGSSSSRWLFSSVATDRAEQHHDQNPAAQKVTVPCSGARQLSPWMLRFRCLANLNRDGD